MANTKIQVTGASGRVLEWFVVKALGYKPFFDLGKYHSSADPKAFYLGNADFTREWDRAGRLLQTSQMDLRKTVQYDDGTTLAKEHAWKAEMVATNPYFCAHGETPQVAICRCFVASRLGYIADAPEELLK